MIDIISATLPRRRLRTRYRHKLTLARMAVVGALAGRRALRALVLALVALMLMFVGLMQLTGHYEAGAPVLGSILLIGFGAAQYTQK